MDPGLALVVGADRASRSEAASGARAAGYRTLVFADAGSALDWLEEESPDVTVVGRETPGRRPLLRELAARGVRPLAGRRPGRSGPAAFSATFSAGRTAPSALPGRAAASS